MGKSWDANGMCCIELDQNSISRILAMKFNSLPHSPFGPFMKNALENILGKGENDGNQNFFISQNIFHPSKIEFLLFRFTFIFVICF